MIKGRQDIVRSEGETGYNAEEQAHDDVHSVESADAGERGAEIDKRSPKNLRGQW